MASNSNREWNASSANAMTPEKGAEYANQLRLSKMTQKERENELSYNNEKAFQKSVRERDNLLEMMPRAFANPDVYSVYKSDLQIADENLEEELEDPDTLELTNSDILSNGKFRFNDVVLDIPPEQISIHTDENERSILLMRQEVPVAAQEGKRRVRIIVNFPIDVSGGWSKLSKMVIQIRKTPIATIENEKIRKELFGNLDDFENIGVVVDNFSGYVEDEFPTLLRCTLQMSWFNHAPYVESIKYITENKQGDIKWQITPSEKFVEFYKAGTSNGNVFINDPDTLVQDRSLVIMYKEYYEFKNTVIKSKINNGSNLNGNIEGGDDGTFKNAEALKQEGWYLASEAKDKWDELMDGVFYRWKRVEIPYTDLDTSGALILQNMSFSLSTNPSYISMESYAFPTIQFMGGSVSEIRAMVFAAAEYQSYSHRIPIGTSKSLSNLMAIFKKVSDDRIKFPKYAKENQLLICHPLAKLMKYRSHANSSSDLFIYLKEGGFEKDFFNIDDYLPVILSNSASSTVQGIPYASRVQLDFKETRLAQNKSNIKYRGTTGSTNNEFKKTQNKNPEEIHKNILKELFARTAISLGSEGIGLFGIDQDSGVLLSGNPNYSIKERYRAKILIDALNALRHHERSVVDIDSAFKSQTYRNNVTIGRDDKGGRYKIPLRPGTIDIVNVLRPDFVEQFVIGFYSEYATALAEGESWVKPYMKLFEDFARITPMGHRDVYSDMMIPEKETTPAYYFASNESRTQLIRNNILRNLPKNYHTYAKELQEALHTSKEDFPAAATSYPTSYNHASMPKNNDKGVGRIHEHNSEKRKEMTVEYAMARASAPADSLNKVYPAFQIHLYSDRYLNAGKGSANDIANGDLSKEAQYDLLDLYDLSSILDIRIIKDEYEAADVMIIKILQTQKKLMTSNDKDPTYNPETFSFFEKGGVVDRVTDGTSVLNTTKSNNLEVIGLKEGTKIRAYLGYTTDLGEMGLEFNGRISAINGKDVIEIYCMGDGHELIQDTKGYEREEMNLDSDTVDLIGDVLDKAEEVKSFGNTKYEIIRGAGIALPDFMGGTSALDNIYAPLLRKGWDFGQFGLDNISVFLGSFATVGSIGGMILGAGVLASGPLATIGIIALGVSAAATSIALLSSAYSPCQYLIYQQTIWDILQEMTLRHPGYICAVVPFDNRSTIYFGEPDGLYFHRGIKSSLERAVLASGKADFGKNTTIREYQEKREEARINRQIESNDPTTSFAKLNTKFGAQVKDIISKPGKASIDQLALLNMQKTFRSYHFVTSEHDIISNDIEASSVGVANSVQVYHPVNDDNGDPDGKEWGADYKLTDKMKADDDIYSQHVNNKIFTFHNAFGNSKTLSLVYDSGDLQLPQRYAKAILCKELENSYKGKLTILGRSNIKPHDVVILRDTHNKISGPIGVQRVTHIISPTSGWVTNIYPKFMIFPDSASGAFQMKAVLKASRYWLGAEAELFYSSMEKFRPSEIASSDQFMDDFSRAIGLAVGGEEFDQSLSKTDADRGEISGVQNVINNSAGDALAAGATFGANQALGGSEEIVKGMGRDLKKSGDSYRKVGRDFKQAWGAEKYFAGPVSGAWKGIKTTGLIGGKLFMKTAGGFAGGFLAQHLLTGMAEGFISYMKYRQPVSIFPLTKEGKPWTAGLNGMVENTAIEHLKLQSDRAADKMGFMFGVAKDLFLHWTSEMPPDIGYGGIYDVVPGSIEDGDTIKIMNGTTAETVRIKGFDAGELKDEGLTKRGGPNEVFMGNLARRRLKELITQSGGKVEVVRNKPDNYARTIGEVTVKVNGRDVADILREEGLVLNYASGSPKKLYYDKFPGGAEQVWGEKRAIYNRDNPNSEAITPLLNTLNRTENQTLSNDAFVVNPNDLIFSQRTQ